MGGAIERLLRKQSGVSTVSSPAIDQSIGQILVAQGVLQESDISAVTDHARTHGVRFGEAAVAKRLIRQKDLDKALAHQYQFPYMQPGKGKLSKELVAAYKPLSRKAEVFRHIRAQLMLGGMQDGQKMLAVVSPSRKDGRSYLAANLAVAFAQLGKKTLLIDGHLQRPRQHEIFRLGSTPGVSSMVSGRGGALDSSLAIGEIGGLSVLAAGAKPPNPDELIAGDAFGRLCQNARREYDIVLMDTPPGYSSTAVDWIAARCGNVLVVYRRGKTGLAEARNFSERMRARASVAGAVLNTN